MTIQVAIESCYTIADFTVQRILLGFAMNLVQQGVHDEIEVWEEEGIEE
jgi:hypothetical protein